MATKTETTRAGEFIQGEAGVKRSRDEITVKSGQNLTAGDVIAKQTTAGTVTGAAPAGNTGDGTIGTLSVGVGAQEGVYELVALEPATNAGEFSVEAPNGEQIGVATVAVAFTGEINFTIADGATDFASGDRFQVTVSLITEQWVVLPNDGSDDPAGVLYDDVDASAAAVKGTAIVRDAEVNGNTINWPTGISAEDKDLAITALAELGIIVR